MRQSQIFSVLDLANKIREQGGVFNPLFVGPAGLGKSQIVQQWAKRNNLPFLDIRAAYFEAPDMIGFPSIERDENSRARTVHNLPDIWPTNGKGIVLLEEPNRGTNSIMNTMMQILTDRKVHKYDLPPGWIIVGCMNPESEEYEVNTMDTALKDRFEFFHIEYNKEDFVRYMRDNKWDRGIVDFVDAGVWLYKEPENISKNAGSKYISPRTLSKLNAAIQAGISDNNGEFNLDLALVVYKSILGENIGSQFYQFKHFERPVTFDELFVDENSKSDKIMMHKDALKRLKKYSDPKNYKAGIISLTVNDVVTNEKRVSDELLTIIALALPADQSVHMIKKIQQVREDDNVLERLFENSVNLKDYLKAVLKQGQLTVKE